MNPADSNPGTMSQADIDDAAMFLLHLRMQRDQVSGLPHELAPKSLADAYAIQDVTHRYGGWPIGMLKVGCTSRAAQDFLRIPHPIGGRVGVDAIFESGATVPRSFFAAAPLLECEIAVRIDAAGDVDAVAPAIEMVDSRFLNTARVDGPAIVADNSASGGAILGTPVAIRDVGELAEIGMVLRAGAGAGDPVEIATGDASALMGGPAHSVEWVLEHEAARGRDLVGGTWIITGTCTGLTPTEWGRTYTADFGSLGSVGFTLGS